MYKITFALTSCGRPDLLEKTLDSFLLMNTYPIMKYIIIEDSTIDGINDKLIEKYKNINIEWIFNKNRFGQIKSIDTMYSKISTEYIFHCEEDCLFTDKGFIENSLQILNNNPNIIQVWLRDHNDTNGHPIEYYSDEYDLICLGYNNIWNGFSFNPSLKRLCDYKLIGSCYQKIGHESDLSIKYAELGFRAAILKNKYVEHIGTDRHVEDINYFLSVIAIFKNETMNLKVWLDHYLWQGVDHFYLIDNGSSDNPLNILDSYIKDGLVTYRFKPKRFAQEEHYNEMYKIIKSKWVMVVDLDEFVYSPWNTISNVLNNELKDYNLIYMNWIMFGSNDLIDHPNDIRTAITKRKSIEESLCNTSFNYLKYICKKENILSLGIHEPEFINKNSINSVICNTLLRLNHYPIQSKYYFNIVKSARGDVHNINNEYIRDDSYFNKYDYNTNIIDNVLKDMIQETLSSKKSYKDIIKDKFSYLPCGTYKYGSQGKYTYKYLKEGKYIINNELFGCDPIPYVIKLLYNSNDEEVGIEGETIFIDNIIDNNNNILINNKIGFIILRHVNSEITNQYWIYCYECIRKFYPENLILIIDDNSDYKYISNHTLYKCTIINSEYHGRGELLPYYYYYHNKLFETAVIIHDSVFINRYIDLNTEKYKMIWYFEHDWDQYEDEEKMIKLFNNTELYDYYKNKEFWKGCFGGMSIITFEYLETIYKKYDLSLLLDHVLNRYNRCSFERVIGCILQKEYKMKT